MIWDPQMLQSENEMMWAKAPLFSRPCDDDQVDKLLLVDSRHMPEIQNESKAAKGGKGFPEAGGQWQWLSFKACVMQVPNEDHEASNLAHDVCLATVTSLSNMKFVATILVKAQKRQN